MIIEPQQLFTPWQGKSIIPRNFIVSDKNYFCPTKEMVQKEISPKYWKWLSSLKLTKWMHRWDCDNFADAFKLFSCGYYEQVIESEANGIAVGVIHYNANSRAEDGTSGGHAINIIYINNELNNLEVIFLEPQNCSIIQLNQREFESIKTVYI